MSFNDIKGHDNIKLFFRKTLRDNVLSHAYIFSGPDGVGKALMAHTLSKALNCLNKKDDCCDTCASCVKIEKKNHPDVMWFEKEGASIDIKSVRRLQERISLKPYEAKKKIYIIPDSHDMTQEAANCLLKTLEEPPVDSVIILMTPKPDELLLTVRSRCKTIKFGPLGLDLRMGLAQIQGLTKEEALFLSRLANSGAPTGIFSDERPKKGMLEYKNMVIDEFSPQAPVLLDDASFIFKEKKDGIIFALSVLGAWYRDAFLLKNGGAESFVINSDRMAELGKMKDEFSAQQLEGILKEIEDAIYYVDANVGPKIALNNLKIRIGEKVTA